MAFVCAIIALFSVSAKQYLYFVKDGMVFHKDSFAYDKDSLVLKDSTLQLYIQGKNAYETSLSSLDSISLTPIIHIGLTEVDVVDQIATKDILFSSSPKGEISADDVQWFSTNISVATMSKGGKLWIKSVGDCVITGVYGSQTVSCNVHVRKGNYVDSYEYVDLGLPSGTLWAAKNTKASSNTGNGGYYAYGETSEKNSYYSNSTWYDKTASQLYSKGVLDESNHLTPAYDAATKNIGKNWRTPTIEEFDELLSLENEWCVRDGVNGREFTGKNGNKLFLPASGYKFGSASFDKVEKKVGQKGSYWSSSFLMKGGAYGIEFDSSLVNPLDSVQVGLGMQVRAVVDFKEPVLVAKQKFIVFDRLDSTVTWEISSLPEGKISANDVDLYTTDATVAKISKDGVITPVGAGTCYVQTYNKGVKTSCTVVVDVDTVEKTLPEEHEYVDLGLTSGTKWATMNIGAAAMDEMGSWHVWGYTDIREKSSSSQKYSNLKYPQTIGLVDDDYDLISSYDVATALWGKNWKLPNKADFDELTKECISSYVVTENGVIGMQFTSQVNGNSIFLPCCGYDGSSYACSTTSVDYNGTFTVYGLHIDMSSCSMLKATAAYLRHVRPVYTTAYDNLISLVKDSVSLPANGESITIEIKSDPAGAVSLSDLEWVSSADTIASVENGVVTPHKPGSCFVRGSYKGQGVLCKVTVTNPVFEGIEYVDLGLPSGTLWAGWNLGATKETEVGDRYSWGETEPKVNLNSSESKWSGMADSVLLDKGVIGTDYVLTSENDAATAVWGKNWRMPTQNECEELCELTTEVTSVNGVGGFRFYGANGNSMFIPFDTQAFNGVDSTFSVWSSSLYKKKKATDTNLVGYARYINGSSYTSTKGVYNIKVFSGSPIRPVRVEHRDPIISFMIDDSIKTRSASSPTTLEFSCKPVDIITPADLEWTSSDESVATVKDGVVTPVGGGDCVITATYEGKSQECAVHVTESLMMDGHEYVDLGLPSGTMWAACNIGADDELEGGTYFKWKREAFYELGEDSLKSLGIIDENNNLSSQYDYATELWGENWAMPTKTQMSELLSYCTTKEMEYKGQRGILFTSKKTSQTIFFPFPFIESGVARGYYWSKTWYENGYAHCFKELFNYWKVGYEYYWEKYPIRPVYQSKK